MIPLYRLGGVDWLTSQALYHTLPVMHEEGVILCWPLNPYVSLGCHQDWEEFDTTSYVPVVRRHVGGTLVYLDSHQVFFQVILDPSRHSELHTPAKWYRYALYPVIQALAQLGLDAEFKEPADILVNGRKISGNAGGQIEDSVVVVGNILLRFSPEIMVKVRAGSTMLKTAFAEAMSRHLVTLEELSPDRAWTAPDVMDILAESFQRHWSTQSIEFPWNKWRPALETVGQDLIRPDWIKAPGHRPPYHQVKVREGIYLRQPRQNDFSNLVAEVNTEKHCLNALWGLSASLPLPLFPSDVDRHVPNGILRRILYQLLDVPVPDPLYS